MKFFRSPYLSFFLAALACLSGLALWAFCAPDTVFLYARETGPIKGLTEWGYLLAIALFLFFGIAILKRGTLAAVLVILTYVVAHDANLHNTPFSSGLLKMKFWLLGVIPAANKLIATAFLVPVICAALYLIAFRTGAVLSGLRERMSHAISIFTVVALTVFTNLLNNSLKVLGSVLGWTFPPWLWALKAALKEPLECLIPFLFIVALFQYRNYIRERGMAFFSRY